MAVIGHDNESIKEKRHTLLYAVDMFYGFIRKGIHSKIWFPIVCVCCDQHNFLVLGGVTLCHKPPSLSRYSPQVEDLLWFMNGIPNQSASSTRGDLAPGKCQRADGVFQYLHWENLQCFERTKPQQRTIYAAIDGGKFFWFFLDPCFSPAVRLVHDLSFLYVSSFAWGRLARPLGCFSTPGGCFAYA